MSAEKTIKKNRSPEWVLEHCLPNISDEPYYQLISSDWISLFADRHVRDELLEKITAGGSASEVGIDPVTTSLIELQILNTIDAWEKYIRYLEEQPDDAMTAEETARFFNCTVLRYTKTGATQEKAADFFEKAHQYVYQTLEQLPADDSDLEGVLGEGKKPGSKDLQVWLRLFSKRHPSGNGFAGRKTVEYDVEAPTESAQLITWLGQLAAGMLIMDAGVALVAPLVGSALTATLALGLLGAFVLANFDTKFAKKFSNLLSDMFNLMGGYYRPSFGLYVKQSFFQRLKSALILIGLIILSTLSLGKATSRVFTALDAVIRLIPASITVPIMSVLQMFWVVVQGSTVALSFMKMCGMELSGMQLRKHFGDLPAEEDIDVCDAEQCRTKGLRPAAEWLHEDIVSQENNPIMLFRDLHSVKEAMNKAYQEDFNLQGIESAPSLQGKVAEKIESFSEKSIAAQA